MNFVFKKFWELYKNIKKFNKQVENYKNDTVIQSLPAIAYVNKAKKLINDKKYNDAKELLILALDISPDDALVLKYLGKIFENEKNFSTAVQYYEKSSGLNIHDKEIWLRLGMCYLYTGNFEKSIMAFEKANMYTPNNTDVYTGWGMALMRQKKYALAKDKFNYACTISKYNYTAILLSAVMEKRLGEYEIAEEKISFLIKVAPNESSLYEYSHLKLIKQNYDEAIEYANKTIECNKLMLPAYFILAEAYSILKDSENVCQTFNKALEVDLDSPSLHFEYGKCAIRLLDFKKAREEFLLAIKKDNNNEDAKIGLALLDAYNMNFDLLEEVKNKNLNNVYVQEAIGYQYLSEKRFSEAVDIFKNALKTDCNQTYVYYGLVLAYIGLDEKMKIKENFEIFTQKNPKYLKGLLDYSQWLINVSDFEEAQRKLRKAQKLEDTNTLLLNMLFLSQYALVKKNVSEYNIKEAISVALKAIEAGEFKYYPEKQELETMLENIQGKQIN